MAGERAGIVNTAMKEVFDEVIPEVIAGSDSKLELSIAVLLFSDQFPDGVKWVIDEMDMEEIANDHISWTDLPQDLFDGGASIEDGILAVINNGNRMEVDARTLAPAIILISDGGEPASYHSYDEVLEYEDKECVNYSIFFRHSIRVAIGIDVADEAREQVKRFGKIPKRMVSSGLRGYYDTSSKYQDVLIDIIKFVTETVSLTI